MKIEERIGIDYRTNMPYIASHNLENTILKSVKEPLYRGDKLIIVLDIKEIRVQHNEG